MKVMAFNARPDERAFFDHFSQSLDMEPYAAEGHADPR